MELTLNHVLLRWRILAHLSASRCFLVLFGAFWHSYLFLLLSGSLTPFGVSWHFVALFGPSLAQVSALHSAVLINANWRAYLSAS